MSYSTNPSPRYDRHEQMYRLGSGIGGGAGTAVGRMVLAVLLVGAVAAVLGYQVGRQSVQTELCGTG